MTENTPQTAATEKLLQQMTFPEYWNFLRDFDFQEFKQFKVDLCTLLGIEEQQLRFRKRNPEKISRAERLVISAWISDKENNSEITVQTLFNL